MARLQPKRIGIIICAQIFLLLAGGILTASSLAGDWPNWRGPFFNGSTDETNLPATWSESENVAWVTPMPGPGAGTPIIVGDRVFASSSETGSPNLWAVCLDRKTGQILWKNNMSGKNKSVGRNDMSSPSPAADDQRCVFLFGSGELAAFDHQGKKLWRRDLEEDYGPFSIKFGYSSSPLLCQGKLYVLIVRNPDASVAPSHKPEDLEGPPLDSFLLCLDPSTGKTIWKQDRASDAVKESTESYSTPVPRGADQIVVAGADCITGHNRLTGEEIWRLEYNPMRRQNWRLVPSPTMVGDLILGAIPRGAAVFAFKPDVKKQLSMDDAIWTFDDGAPDVVSALYYGDRLYVMDEKGKLSSLDPKTGAVFWQEQFPPGIYRASPTGADGKIYFMNMDGLVVVVKAGGEACETLLKLPMGDKATGASISAAGGRLFIRTNSKLTCVAK